MKLSKFEVVVQDSKSGAIHDLSNVVGSVSIEGQMEDSAGRCNIKLKKLATIVPINEGSTITVKTNDGGQFFGFVFSIQEQDEFVVDIIAYDQLRYLKNSDTYVFSGKSLEYVISTIGKDFLLRIGTLEKTNYILPATVYDNKSLGDIITKSINQLLVNTGKWFILRDEYGSLCLRDVSTLRTNIVIGDKSLLSSYTYKSDIDKDTFNKIKLVQDNTKTGKRDVYIQQDSNTIKQYGLLQHYEVVDENMNSAQIKQRAEQLLKIKNSPKRTLNLNCDGIPNLKPGDGVYIDLKQPHYGKISQYAIVNKVTHTFSNMQQATQVEVIIE